MISAVTGVRPKGGYMRHGRSLTNRNAIALCVLASLIFMALFVFGVVYELSGTVFGYKAKDFDKVLEYGLNNGLIYSLVCATIAYLFIRFYTIDLLISQDGANIFLKTSMWLFSFWILNLIVYLTTSYFHVQILIPFIALLIFLLSLLIRNLSEKYAQFAADHNLAEDMASANAPVFFSFLEWLFKKERPPMPPIQ